MIYITGDTHGIIEEFEKRGLLGDSLLKAGDYLIVAGDFGFIFRTKGTMSYLDEQMDMEKLKKLPYTILFVDGNHENFFRLYNHYPTEMWNGGRIHRIAPNIIHLMRGQVYEIEGKRIFTMGGGYSRDKASRIEGDSWWREEMPSNGEYREATASLKDVNMQVDVIVTHTAPRKVILGMLRSPDEHELELTGFFDWLMDEVTYDRWYFGHWHTDSDLGYRGFRTVYSDVVPIGE